MTVVEQIADYTERLVKLGLPHQQARDWAGQLILAKRQDAPRRLKPAWVKPTTRKR